LRAGGFEPAMLAAERLEYLEAVVLNRANNDWLEIGIEAGLLGYAMVRPPSRRVSRRRCGRGALRVKSAASSSSRSAF
jgi:hypothetical protein